MLNIPFRLGIWHEKVTKDEKENPNPGSGHKDKIFPTTSPSTFSSYSETTRFTPKRVNAQTKKEEQKTSSVCVIPSQVTT